MPKSTARRRTHENSTRRDVGRPVHAELSWREARAILDEEIGRLPQVYRASFLLCCLENQSCADVAALLRIKPGTVWSRVARAKQLLQKRLTKRGVELAALLSAAAITAGSAMAAVPSGLIGLTSRAAVETLASPGLASVSISPRVISLVQGMMKGMMLSQLKAMCLVVLVFGSAIACLGAGARDGCRNSHRLPMHLAIRSFGAAELYAGKRPDLPNALTSEIPCYRSCRRLGTIHFARECPGCHRLLPMGVGRASGSGWVVHILGNGNRKRSRGLRAFDSP